MNVKKSLIIAAINLTVFFLFAVSSVFPQTSKIQPQGFSPQDFLNYEYARDPQISPDGKKIIYVRNFVDVMSDTYCSNLWIVNFDGTGHWYWNML